MSSSIPMEAPGSRPNLRSDHSFRTILVRILLFVAVPLFLEFGSYLFQSEIFPAYLSFSTNLLNLSIGFFFIALLLIAISFLLAILLRPTRIPIERIAPPLFFFLFLALTLNRLLPRESGFSIPRLMVLGGSFLLAIVAFLLLSKRRLPVVRLFLANSLYCLAAAYLLPFLFRFPVHNWLSALLIHAGVFTALLFVPWKIIVATIVFLIILQLNNRTSVSRFAPPQKLAPFHRVILVGIDGLSPEVVSELAKANQLPVISGILGEGAAGRLHTLNVPYSPLIWNTIYTGATPEEHGVMSFTSTAFPGSQPFLSLWLDHWSNSDWSHRLVQVMKRSGLVKTLAPARSKHRLQPALWNMVDQNGADSLVVGGWTTYPPEKIKGTFISDYAFAAKPESSGTFYPPGEKVRALFQWKPDVSDWPANLQRYVARDERVHYVSTELIKSLPLTSRFVFVYYSSIDAFGHHLGTNIDRTTTSPEQRRQLISVRDKLYQRMDSYIEDYRKFVQDRTLLIVCSDHGFHNDKRQHNYPVDGAILMLGNGIRNLRIEGSVNDIAPTVAYALGMNPSKLFRGLPLKQAFNGIIPELPAKQYLRAGDFYETLTDDALEREKMEELEDLQYINK